MAENNLSTWLSEKVRDTGLRVEEFAQRVGISRSSLYAYIHGSRRPDQETMALICTELQVPIEEAMAQYTPATYGYRKKVEETR